MLPRLHNLIGSILAAVLISGAQPAAARDLIYVLESTVPTVKVGTAYDMADRIDVPAGASVRVVMPSGKTQMVKGPYSGPLSDLAKGEKPNDSVMAWLKNLLQTGGSTERTPGATRSVRPPPAPVPFSWTAIPIGIDSTICIPKGAKIELRRSSSARAEQISVIDEATAQRGVAEFAVGQASAPWPGNVSTRSDATYALAHDGGARRRATLRVLESQPEEADILRELAARNCKYQFDAWVREKTGAR